MNIKSRTLLLISTILTLSMLFSNTTSADTLVFQDDFNDGNSNGWSQSYYENCKTSQPPWEVKSYKHGIKINESFCWTHSVPDSLSIPSDKDYNFEVDISFPNTTKVDRNIIFKYQDIDNRYGLHFYENKIIYEKLVNGEKVKPPHGNQYSYTFQANTDYHFKFEVLPDEIRVYINDVLELTITDTPPTFPNKTIALRATTGSVYPSEVWFDNVTISTLDTAPTPTPTPTPKILDVVDYKQYEGPWSAQEYDHANDWAWWNPSVSRWGCAMTSASMILNYNGHNTTPETLNDWLKANNGFSREGWLIWSAIKRYTQIHPEGSTLEFSYHPPSNDFISSLLDINIPPIIKHVKANGNMHFLVAKGEETDDFIINDPASTKTKLSEAKSYWGNVYAIGKFTPSNTDLSDITLFVDEHIDISVASESGEIVGEQYYFKEGPYADPTDPDADTGQKALNSFYFPKPSFGEYTITLSGPGEYQLDTYLYDQEGKVSADSVSGSIEENETSSYTISFGDLKLIFPKNVLEGFENLLKTWENGKNEGLISSDKVYSSIKYLLKISQRQYEKHHPFISKLFLRYVLAKIRWLSPRFIDEEFSDLVREKIELQMGNF